ncbi:hypothetical protein HKX48_008319 [Thoreauomyces humboldtii]|nr:hypothetical protein HKX48_008319 [Thoreauomyces humboldtii]
MKPTEEPLLPSQTRSLRILIATEYLPPYVSGIANRFKNLTKGYKDAGHVVTIASISGSECDIVVPSVRNPFYLDQRMFIIPPLGLLCQLMNPFSKMPYNLVHMVSPLCLSFVPLAPLFKLRGVKIYVSYHCLMEYYKEAYFYNRTVWHRLMGDFLHVIYTFLYFIPLIFFAEAVGVPSAAADSIVARYANRVHYMKSGLDTDVFTPRRMGTSGNMDEVLLRLGRALSVLDSHLNVVTHDDACAGGSTTGPVLVYVGRLAPEKNVQFLIRCMSHPSLSAATLVVIGDGPSTYALEELARETVGHHSVHSTAEASAPSTALHRIIFTGMIASEPMVAQCYAAADLFVSASASETFGFTVAEALACGTPAVVVSEGAFKVVYGRIRDWMFDEGDAEGFVERVLYCWRDGEARTRARSIAVEDFGIGLAVNDLLYTYRDIVGEVQEQ